MFNVPTKPVDEWGVKEGDWVLCLRASSTRNCIVGKIYPITKSPRDSCNLAVKSHFGALSTPNREFAFAPVTNLTKLLYLGK
jgi:hypothetical protein